MGTVSGKRSEMKLKIITTRPDQKGSGILPSRCVEIVNIPVTRLVRNKFLDPQAIMDFNPTIGVFTSSLGSQIFLEMFPGKSLSEMLPIAIGTKTAEALSRKYSEIRVPAKKTSTGVNLMLDSIASASDRIALFSSSKSNGVVLKHLEKKKWPHLSVELYDAEPLEIGDLAREIMKAECFGLIVTSSMEARTIFDSSEWKNIPPKALGNKHIFAIGETTLNTLIEMGIKVSNPVGKSNLQELVEALESEYCKEK